MEENGIVCASEWTEGVLVAVDYDLVDVERAPVLPSLECCVRRLRVVWRPDDNESRNNANVGKDLA